MKSHLKLFNFAFVTLAAAALCFCFAEPLAAHQAAQTNVAKSAQVKKKPRRKARPRTRKVEVVETVRVADVNRIPDDLITASEPVKKATIISGGILNGKAISLPQPIYPPVAKAANASGTVVIQITIDEEGQVISAAAVSGHPLLKAAAVSAARGAKFAPTKLSGVPVKVTGTLVYDFGPRIQSESVDPPLAEPEAEQSTETTPADKAEEPEPIYLTVPPEGIAAFSKKIIVIPAPKYPEVAKAARASGPVVVKVTIGEDGSVIAAEALNGHPLLRAAAVEAARGAKFTPTTLNGRPARVVGTIQFNFHPQH